MRICPVAAMLLLLLSFANFASCGRTQIARSPDLTYVMTVDSSSASKHIAHISISFPNVRSSSLKFGPHPFLFENEISSAMSTRIFNFTATNEKGQSLRPYKPGVSSWAITTMSAKQINVDYDVAMNITEPIPSGGYLNYLGKDYGLSLAAWVFLVPLDVDVEVIGVRFSLPSGWGAYTPWDSDGSNYTASPPDYFATSTFAVGKFELFSKTVRNTNATVAVYAGWNQETRKAFALYSFKTFEYMTEVFQASVVPRHLAIYVPRLTNEQNLCMEWSQSQGVFVYSPNPIDAIVGYSHRIFHIYNAFPPVGMRVKGESEEWSKEGINTYYQMDKTLRKIGLMEHHEILSDDYRTYQTGYLETANDAPIVKADVQNLVKNWEAYYFIIFRKGSLVSFALDEAISKLTVNRSLDDVLAYMYQKYGCFKNPRPYWPYGVYSNAGYSNEDLLHALNLVTGYDFKPFFQKYVYGNEKLPLKIVSGDLDVDWPELLQAMKLTSVMLTTTAATVSVIPATETYTSEKSTLTTRLRTTTPENEIAGTTSAQLATGLFTTEILMIGGLAFVVLAVVAVFYFRRRGR